MAAAQDYEGFYDAEMKYRELMGYPPVEQLLAVLMTGPLEELLDTAARYLKDFAVRLDKNRQLQIVGPASPYVGKVNDVYRRVLYLKGADYKLLIEVKNRMEQYIEINEGFKTMRIQFDFNPMNIF
jgi:primosomal protein N' (replication factor Y)